MLHFMEKYVEYIKTLNIFALNKEVDELINKNTQAIQIIDEHILQFESKLKSIEIEESEKLLVLGVANKLLLDFQKNVFGLNIYILEKTKEMTLLMCERDIRQARNNYQSDDESHFMNSKKISKMTTKINQLSNEIVRLESINKTFGIICL